MKNIFYGLLLALIFAVSGGVVSAHAMDYPTNLPDLPAVTNGHYVVLSKNGETKLVTLQFSNESDISTIELKHLRDGDAYTFFVRGKARMNVYTLTSSNTWNHYIEHDANIMSSGVNVFYQGQIEYIYSTLDILDDTGDVVFPLPPAPLYQVVGEIAEEATVKEAVNLVEVMMVLTIAAVSCLALLISLPLLKKVLSRFLH